MGPIIDGRAWTRERICFLEAALADDDLDDGQRQAVGEELERLRDQSQVERRRRRWWWALGGPRL